MRTIPPAVLALVVVACSKSPPAERPRDVTVAPVDASAGGPVAPVPATASADAGGCAKDSDCALRSSYCGEAPCVCLALPKSAPKRACSGGTVKCFVDPCMKKGARCQSGACVVGAE